MIGMGWVPGWGASAFGVSGRLVIFDHRPHLNHRLSHRLVQSGNLTPAKTSSTLSDTHLYSSQNTSKGAECGIGVRPLVARFWNIIQSPIVVGSNSGIVSAYRGFGRVCGMDGGVAGGSM